jgi:putative ABC transport system permease protein
MSAMTQPLLRTLRSLRRAPVFTIAAVVTLALGIGAVTSVLSIVDGVLLRSLPYRDAGQLAMVLEEIDAKNWRLPSYQAYRDMRDATATGTESPVSGLAFLRGNGALMRTDAGVERVITWWATPGFFSLMGSGALHGRVFSADEEKAGANRVAVISYRFWNKRFNGDKSVVGRSYNIDGAPATIVGVMPREFEYPSYVDFWMPIADIEATDVALQQRGMHVDSRTIVRMKSAGDSTRTAATLNVVTAELARRFPEEAGNYKRVMLPPINKELFGDIKPTLLLLAVAASLVMLLGCLNVATLSLVRASVRARELAVRAALGASRAHIVRELFLEGAALSLAGAVGGTMMAYGVVSGIRKWTAYDLPRAKDLQVDGALLLIALGVSVAALLLTSLLPAWQASRLALATKLHGGHRGAAGNRMDSRIRSSLVALQFGFAVMLLIGAGLLIQSSRRLGGVQAGWDEQKLATVAVFPPSPGYGTPDEARNLYERLHDAVAAVPGVQSVALMNHAPGGGITTKVLLPGRTIEPSQQQVLYGTASTDYLKTLGAQVVQGRWFTDDDMRSPDAAGFVINETMARKFWPGEDAIGKNMVLHRASSGRPNVGEPMYGAVIGVVADMHSFGKDAPPPPEAWVPYTREVWGWITLLVRAESPAKVAAGVRKAVLSVDPNIPLDAGPTGGVYFEQPSSTLDRRALTLGMLSAFATCALVLAAIGLYGVVAYTVAQRTREVGIRMALGSTRVGVARLVLTGALKMVAAGVAIGLIAAFAGTRVITSLLFNTTATDLSTYVTVPLTLAIVALLATWWPTRKATRVDPTIAMRAE